VEGKAFKLEGRAYAKGSGTEKSKKPMEEGEGLVDREWMEGPRTVLFTLPGAAKALRK
jgi:hypothetical protein